MCGAYGSKKCGQCHQVSYCSREHQVEDWKIGHQEICKKIQAWKKERGLDESKEVPKSIELPKFRKYSDKFLFKEFEVLTDVEPEASSGTTVCLFSYHKSESNYQSFRKEDALC